MNQRIAETAQDNLKNRQDYTTSILVDQTTEEVFNAINDVKRW